MEDGNEPTWPGPYRMSFPDDDRPEWTPFTEVSFDDQRVTVALHGFVPRDYWAKAIGMSSDGAVTYKLLPLDRA